MLLLIYFQGMLLLALGLLAWLIVEIKIRMLISSSMYELVGIWSLF